MQPLLEQIKNPNYSNSRFVAEVSLDEKIYDEYSRLKSSQKNAFRLTKIPKKDKDNEQKYVLTISIPGFEDFDKVSEDFNLISDFFQKVLTTKVVFLIRILLHFSTETYKSDPELPVVLEERRAQFGKIILSGVRVTFPDFKDFESIILDVQNCDHCKTQALSLQVFCEIEDAYSIQFITNVIKKAIEFSRSFVKERDNGKK